jgi:hypothetical protein
MQRHLFYPREVLQPVSDATLRVQVQTLFQQRRSLLQICFSHSGSGCGDIIALLAYKHEDVTAAAASCLRTTAKPPTPAKPLSAH